MRHGDKINNLGKKTAHRKAMMSNMTCSLITYKRITTTLAKAKALRVHAEPLITRAKVDSTHNRRIIFSYLQDKAATTELFTVIGDKVAARPGGYTRIIKLPRRIGDAADMAMIELVDFNEIYTKDGANTADTKKTRRSRRSGGGAKAEGVDSAAPATTMASEPQTAEENIAAHDTAEQDMVADEKPAAPEMPAADEASAPTQDDKANNGEDNG